MDKVLLGASIKMKNFNFEVPNDSKKDKVRLGEEIASKIREQVRESSNDKSQNDEKMMRKIMAKLKSGKKLTTKEENYLKQHNPELYLQYLRIRRMAEALESRLKNADSKEEVNDIIMESLSAISDKDPYKEYIIAALDEVAKEFKNSDGYEALPATSEEASEKAGSSGKSEGKNDSSDDKNSEDDFDPMSWSPLQEIVDSMPTIDFPA